MPRNGTIKNGRILKQNKRNGYLFVCLSKNDKKKTVKTSRLVAEVFIENPENKSQVNHIDGNKLNNCVYNLEWCTCKENIQHAWNNKLKFITNKMKKHIKEMQNNRIKKVRQYDIEGNFIKEWDSALEIENHLGIKKDCIYRCCQNKNKTSYGYVWKYSEEENRK